MRIRDLLAETFSAIRANRARSLLTILGIVIGISAVIAMTALIDGVKYAMVAQLGLNQSRLVMINAYPNGEPLQRSDLRQLEKGMTDYEFLTGTAGTSSSVSTGQVKLDGIYTNGVEDKYFVAMGSKFAEGRGFSEDEVDESALVAVVSQGLANKLWGQDADSVVGKSLSVGNDRYSVVGVLEDANGYTTGNETLYVPLSTFQTRIYNWGLDQVYGYAREGADLDTLGERTKSYLVSYYHLTGEDADGYVYIQTMKSMIDQLDSTMGAFQLLMTAVAGISLVVGGIGIMNMMLTNVTERIREIGLRKALGARRSDITRQFLLESVALCLVGGVFGILFGYLGAWALATLGSGLITSGMGMQITPVVTPSTVLLASGICIGIGLVFGYGPARRASRLDPVEALRYQ